MTPQETAIDKVVDLLVDGDFAAIEKLTGGRRLSAADLERAVSDYGNTLSAPPKGWLSSVDVVRVRRPFRRPRFHAAVPLWTKEDGRSDLTLEVRLTEIRSGGYETEVLDLHVL